MSSVNLSTGSKTITENFAQFIAPAISKDNYILCGEAAFDKLYGFWEYYNHLDKKNKKLMESPELFWSEESEISAWCHNFIEMDNLALVELTNICAELQFTPLFNICAYYIAQLLGNGDFSDIFPTDRKIGWA